MRFNLYSAGVVPLLFLLAFIRRTAAPKECVDEPSINRANSDEGFQITRSTASFNGSCNAVPVVDLGYSLYRPTSLNVRLSGVLWNEEIADSRRQLEPITTSPT